MAVPKLFTLNQSVNRFFYSLLVTFLFISCLIGCKPEEPVFCTQEFRSIQVKIINDSIINAFVIDKKNKDTLKCNVWNDLCTVADDGEIFNRLKSGEKRIYTFHALGARGGKVINDFEISRDQCHIIKISGPSELHF